ncbi:nucleolar protein 58 [Nothobranchius furzeri]|uniref:nucleolar protein 58 n=1 Tax=Nothobranchius furzeri TaxID=105023 RepID=UPI0024043158|nr:pre-mRNA-splicing factor CWC22 homolog [Nothobranchius furzeri]
MGGSSLKKVFIWKRKKKNKSPLNKAFKQLKRALPKKKTKRKGLLEKLNLKKDKQKKSDKKKAAKRKGLSLGLLRKESAPSASDGKKEKDRDGLGRVGEKIRKKLSLENKKEPSAETQAGPEAVNLKETERKTTLKKLKLIIRPSKATEIKAND